MLRRLIGGRLVPKLGLLLVQCGPAHQALRKYTPSANFSEDVSIIEQHCS